MVKKCDVLYIHSVKNPQKNVGPCYAVMPMGIIGILNGIRSAGVDVLGLNLAIEQKLDPSFDLLSFLQQTDYKILMTDLHWYEHAFGAMYVVETSKKAHPDRPTIIGGYSSTIYADEIMENFSCVDYIVTGDSDLPTEQLVSFLLGSSTVSPEHIPNLVCRHNAGFLRSPNTWVQTTLDDIDFIHTDFFRHAEYVPYLTVGGVTRKDREHWLCIARGCKFNCSYCCGAATNMDALFRRCNILLRSAEKVASDFIQLTSAGIDHISPSHDLQMFGKDYYHTVFAKIRESGVKPGMYLECFQLPTRDYIDDILQTFDTKKLILVISPISGNEALRKENGKHFSNDALYDAVGYMRSKGIDVQLYYTLNPVGETKAQFMDTVFQMKYLRMMLKMGRTSVFYQRVVLDPLAPMRKAEGIKVYYHSFMDYYDYCQLPPDQKYCSTGFDDGGEVPLEEKLQIYDSVFPVIKKT